MASSTFKSSVNIKSAGGDPKKIAANAEKGSKTKYCTVLGIATSKVKRTDPKDPDKVNWGLAGTFEVSSPITGDTVKGGNLFIVDSLHNMISDQLDKGAKAVSFAAEVYVVEGGTAGFTWEYKFHDNALPEEEDILASVRSLISGPHKPALTDQTEGNVAQIKGKKTS